MGLDISPSWEGGRENQEELIGHHIDKNTTNTLKTKAEEIVEDNTKAKVRPKDFKDEQFNGFTDKLTSKLDPESGRIKSETKITIFIPNLVVKVQNKPKKFKPKTLTSSR